MRSVADLGKLLNLEFRPYQLEAFDLMRAAPEDKQRICLYYKTGAGKSITAAVAIAQLGYTSLLVVAPPSTHASWHALATQLELEVETISHAKFRMKSYKVSRHTPMVVDEFHLLGGHKGQGWKKLDAVAKSIKVPMVLCSATPNYNDAERVYCVQHVLDWRSAAGGYIEFLYRNCETQENPFGKEPIVTGFREYPDAEAYLAALPGVVYLPDDVVYSIADVWIPTDIPEEFELYGLNRRTGRIMASQMEQRFQKMYLSLVNPEGYIYDHVYDMLIELVGQAHTPVLLYADSSQVAEALHRTCLLHGAVADLVTGTTSPKVKQEKLAAFRAGRTEVLIGTATLATGTDGLDKVCDTLIIVCDTSDPSLRRQLLGRILPRGLDTDASKKQFYRLVF